MSSGSPATSWSPTRRQKLLYSIPFVGFALNATMSVFTLKQGGAALAFFIIALVGTLAAAASLLLYLRTRVQLTKTGIAVRSYRTTTFAYSNITDVHEDQFRSGALNLVLRNGQQVRLPAPSGALDVRNLNETERARLLIARKIRQAEGPGITPVTVSS